MTELAANSFKIKRPYSVGEEVANAVIHGLGTVLAIAALTIMVVLSSLYGNGWHIGASIVFGVALIMQYTFSTLYHAIPFPRAKHVLKIFDHVSIYLLIAGTYTPFTLVTLRREGGWWMFGLVWALAVVGIVLETFWLYRPKWLSALVFILMGWLIIFMTRPLIAQLSPGGFWLLTAGGITYTAGTLFYVLKRVRYMHAVWHLFVLGGSVCHFLVVALYVLPPRT